MLKHLQGKRGDSFDLTKCNMLVEFVQDTSGYGLGIRKQQEVEAYTRLLNGELGNRCCCIFDGMDEGGAFKEEIEMYIKTLSSQRHMNVIVSSRETGFDHTHFNGALDKLFQILPLTSAMKRDVISKRLDTKQQPNENLEAFQSRHGGDVTTLHARIQQKFLELSRNPLLLSVVRCRKALSSSVNARI